MTVESVGAHCHAGVGGMAKCFIKEGFVTTPNCTKGYLDVRAVTGSSVSRKRAVVPSDI